MKGETIRHNSTMGKTYWLPCERCTETKHAVLASAEACGTNGNGVIYESRFQIVQCLGCEWISFRQSWSDLQRDPTADDEDGEQLFPPRLQGRRELADVHLLPAKVRDVYREVHGALVGGQPVLAGLGIRTLVEAVCDAKKAPGHDLHTQIQSLVDLQLLTPSDAKVLQGTKWLGNRSAHSARAPTVAQLGAAIAAAEHLLRTVFLVKNLARDLPKRNDRKPKHKRVRRPPAP